MKLPQPLLAIAIAIAAAVLAGTAAAQTVETVRVGNQTKNAFGTILRLQAGDIACYVDLKDDKGATFREMADFEVCEQRSLVNRRVALSYAQRRVQSPECQGDENCKKSIIVTLVTAARPAAASTSAPTPTVRAQAGSPQAGSTGTSLCMPSEMIVFSCTSGQKTISACAPKDAGARRGYLEYRFGDAGAGKPELTLPRDRTVPSQAAFGEAVPFSGGGGAWLTFRQGAYAYTIYTGIGKWGPNGETREKAGLAVDQSGKRIAAFICAGRYRSELGPDLFEKWGIRAGNQDFDFPD
jgi:hypothetical protein